MKKKLIPAILIALILILFAGCGQEQESGTDYIISVNNCINDFIWAKIGLLLLLGTGVLMTVRMHFFQFLHLRHWFKNTIGSILGKRGACRTGESGTISQFQALCTSLAATVGVGNIAGVAAAVVSGGPGAVFWMWIAALFGMMTNFSENLLGIFFRRKNDKGEWSGGAMYYLQDGLGAKKGCRRLGRILACLFAGFTVLASFGIGNMGQVNKIVINIESAFRIDILSDVKIMGADLYKITVGAVITLLAGVIVLGGIQRIAAVAERLIPFMVCGFTAGCLIVIGVNLSSVGNAFAAIFKSAFSGSALWGGAGGCLLSRVIAQGCKRGIFSNEAGLGSTVIINSNSDVKEPAVQGMWGIFEVFADTIAVCTLTALVILTSGVIDLDTGAVAGGLSGDATLVAKAFDSVFSVNGINMGSMFIAAAIFFFAFTTLLGWSHYGAKAWEFLFGTKSVVIYKIIFVLMIMNGAVMTSSLAWEISDTFNGLMMLPNLIGVISLSPLSVKIAKNYTDRKFKNKNIRPMLSYDSDIQKNHEAALYRSEEEKNS